MEGLRGLAIILVFTCHYYDIIWRDLPNQSQLLSTVGSTMLSTGGTGVDLFFVLSGFLIYGAVRKPDFVLPEFLRRRAKRIYPTFLCVFAFYLTISPFLGHVQSSSDRYASRIPTGFPGNLYYLVANLLFLPGVLSIQPLMNVAWSLSYEALFYLCLPLAIMASNFSLRNRRFRVLTILALAAGFLIANIIFPAFFYMPANLAHPSHIRAVMFFGGMVVFELLEFRAITPQRKLYLDISVLFLAVCSIAIGSFQWSSPHSSGIQVVRDHAFTACALLVGYSVLVLRTLTAGTGLAEIFSIGPLRWLGNMSYSFYLVHGLPLHAFGMVAGRLALTKLAPSVVWSIFVVAYPFVFFATTACGAALFLAVEKRLSLVRRSPKTNRAKPIGLLGEQMQVQTD